MNRAHAASRRQHPRRRRGIVSAGCWLFVLLAACSPGVSQPDTTAETPATTLQRPPDEPTAAGPEDARPGMHPCAPGPPLVEEALLEDAERITLEWDPAAAAFTGDPALPDELIHRLDGAVVSVAERTGTLRGSGFLVNAGGRTVVLTAAHVTRDSAYEDLVVVDLNGQRSPVAGGCYAPRRENFPEEQLSAGVDAAVLIPAHPVGSAALTIGDRPSPGDWVLLNNFQDPFELSYGRNLYSAVATGGVVRAGSFEIVTGIGTLHQPEDRHPPTGPGGTEQRPEYASGPGASGGLVADLQGRAVGMTVQATYTMTITDLTGWGASITGVTPGPTSGVMPTVATAVSPTVLLALLDAALADPATGGVLPAP